MLSASNEAERLAALHVSEGIIPAKCLMDGIRIAVTAVNDLDMILSLNFRHIARKKTLDCTGAINAPAGCRPISIHAPQEVADYEQT
jgi:hypothetical protein